MHTERVGCENGGIRPRDPGATVDSGAGVSGEEDAVFNIRGKSASEKQDQQSTDEGNFYRPSLSNGFLDNFQR